jgi:hypothetical protein
MASAPTLRARFQQPLGAWLWLALAASAVSCGGQAESPSVPGSSVPGSGSVGPTAQPPGGARGGALALPEDTCADNPLLAKCQAPLPSSAPPMPVEPPALDLDDPSLSPVERAEAVLGARCGSCHGTPNPVACGVCDGMYDIDDMAKMINTGKIIPCAWTDSLIYQRIARREMPPRNTNLPAPSRAELAVVGNFVDGLCDDLSAGGPSGQAALESWLASSCGSCHGNTLGDAGASERIPLVNVSDMLAQGVIVPCNPDGSLLVQRLRDDSMPPPGVNPRPTAREIRELVAFIDRPCSRR